MKRYIIGPPNQDHPKFVKRFHGILLPLSAISSEDVADAHAFVSSLPGFDPEATVLAVIPSGVVGFGGPPGSSVGFIAQHHKGFVVSSESLARLAEKLHLEKMLSHENDLGVSNSEGFRRWLHSNKASVAQAQQNPSSPFRLDTDYYKVALSCAGQRITIFPLRRHRIPHYEHVTPPVLVCRMRRIAESVISCGIIEAILVNTKSGSILI